MVFVCFVASQPALEDGVGGVRSSQLGTAGGSEGIIGLREVIKPGSRSLLSEFINSSRGVATHARARLALADSTLVAPHSTHGPSALLSAAAVDARATTSPLHTCLL